MDTSCSVQDGELDAAANSSVESHAELAIQGGKVDVTERKHEDQDSHAKIIVECDEAGDDKNVCICPWQGVRLKNEKNGNEKVPNDSVFLDRCSNDNNNSMEFTDNIGICGEESTSKHLVGHEILQQKASAGRDVAEQELVQEKAAKTLECHLTTENVVASDSQSQQSVVNRETVNRNLTEKTNESWVDYDKQLDDNSSLLEYQTKLKRKQVSSCSTYEGEIKEEDIACNKDEQMIESYTIMDHTMVAEQDQEPELQPDKQLYSLDSISDELTNVKNTLSEEASLKSRKGEKDGDSSDIEESSGTTTTSTESDDEASSSSDDEELDTRAIIVMEEDEGRMPQAPPKTRDEILVVDLPAEPEVNITIDEQTRIVEIGQITSVVETLSKMDVKYCLQFISKFTASAKFKYFDSRIQA